MSVSIGVPPGFSPENWARFIDSAIELNAFVLPSVLRKYQSEILDRGEFTVVSPASGESQVVTQSVSVDKSVAYLIDGRERCWVVAGATGKGFPLHTFVSESVAPHVFPFLDLDIKPRSPNAFRSSHVEALLRGPVRPLETAGRVRLQIGHVNFAHHVWNELSALDAWLRTASPERFANLTIETTAEPLGPLRQIFPALRDARFVRPGDEDQPTPQITAHVGSRLVTKEVLERMLQFVSWCRETRTGSTPLPIREDRWPRLWISVRVGNRTAENMAEFLTNLLARTFDRYPDAEIVFDGFSYPVGFFDDERTAPYREKFVSFTKAASAFVEELRTKVRDALGAVAAARMVNTTGNDLAEAILIGAKCDYYVCHAGTLQHKIGWFNRKPGLVHMPYSSENSATWHASQVEGGVTPDFFPKGFIALSSSPPRGRSGAWNHLYKFVDATKAAEFALQKICQTVAAP